MLNEYDRRALSVAHLLSQGKTQNEIVEALQLSSQSEVSRLKKHAIEKNWLVNRVEFPKELTDSEIDFIRNSSFMKMKELEEKSMFAAARSKNMKPINQFHIINVNYTEKDAKSNFCKAAADYVIRIISQSETCAVSWGTTISGIVDEVCARNCPRRKITFIPLSGEPLNNSDRGISPTMAAHRLADAFGSSEKLSLQGVPARIPIDLFGQRKTIQEFIERSKDYNKIFIGEEGKLALIKDVDTIITGIGDVKTLEGDPWFVETREMEQPKNSAGNKSKSLEEISAGNIGGIWLPENENNEEQIKGVNEINERWLGIKKEHVELCSKNATKNNKPGVVVVAFEPEKARILRRSIGMVNRVIISHPLADALLKILNEELGDA